MSDAPPIRAWYPLLLVTGWIAGAIVRFQGLGRLGLTHFDEGVYAVRGLWFVHDQGLAGIDPRLIAYAPPAYDVLVALGYVVVGVGDLAPLLVSLVAGLLSLLMVAALAWAAFGPRAAVAALILAAGSGPHVAMSRMGMTDSLFLMGWLGAMLAGVWFLRSPSWWRAILLGLAVGLVQNSKYNGWLAGVAVVLAAAIPCLTGPRPPLARGLRTSLLLLLAGGLAAACYLPWYRFVAAHGGYELLLEHQRGYLTGPGSYFQNLRLQLGQAVALSGGWSWIAPTWLAAGVLAMAAGPGRFRRPRSIIRAGGIVLLVTIAMIFLPVLPWWLCLGWAPFLLRDTDPARRILGTWWLVLAVLTPLYHPYARLWLPLHAVGWVITAGQLVSILDQAAADPRPSALPTSRRRAVWALVIPVLAVLVHVAAGPVPRARDGLSQPTDQIRRGLETHLPAARSARSLLILARPVVLFEAERALPGIGFRQEADMDSLLASAVPGDWVLVDEQQLNQEADPGAAWQRLLTRWQPVAGSPWNERLSIPVWLDANPDAAFGESPSRLSRWWLLRPRTAR